MSVEWVEASMGTGVPSIDEQHQVLLRILNGVTETLRAGSQPDGVGKMLDDLDLYARKHFSHEEECMEQLECSFADRNKREHQKFLSILESMREKFERTGPSRALAREIESKLSSWLVFHIKGTDRMLRAYARPPGNPNPS